MNTLKSWRNFNRVYQFYRLGWWWRWWWWSCKKAS